MKHLRGRFVVAVCAGFVCAGCFAQNFPPSYVTTPVTSASGVTPNQLFALDVNNDGLSDLVQINAVPPGGQVQNGSFNVSINAGNGSFLPPVTYQASTYIEGLTWGDFNNDGKVDIAVELEQTNQIAVYLGNGDGTFQAPITSTLDLPSGVTFNAFPGPAIVAADFNHDGNQDLVVSAADELTDSDWSVYLLLGDGTGHLTDATVIYYPTSGWMVQTIVGGDFDTDGNADVAVLESMYCSDGTGDCSSNVVSLFGNGGTSFDPVDVTTVSGAMTLGSADLNNDGATDLFGLQQTTNGSGSQLAVFTGHYGRKFSYLYDPFSASTVIGQPFAVANFDGNWDLAALSATYDESGAASYKMAYFLDPGFEGGGTLVYGTSPGGDATYQVGPVAGNFNGDLKPDIAVNASSAAPAGQTQYNATTTTAVGLNNTPSGFYGNCNYPASGQGIHVCSPSAQAAPGQVDVEASANSFGMLRKIELWVNGQKQGEQDLVWGGSGYFDWNLQNMTAGTYDATIYAANIDNTLQRYDFTFTVGNQ